MNESARLSVADKRGAPRVKQPSLGGTMSKHLIVGVAVMVLNGWPTLSRAQIDERLLQVHFIDVGTGDCIWIHTGDDGIKGNGILEGYNIIIDGGDWGRFGRADGYAAASEYLGQGDRLPSGSTIDWVILSHAHSDHNGGLYGFLRDYDVRNILDPGHDKTNDAGEPDRERPRTAYGRFFQAASTELVATGESANFVWGIPDTLKTLNWGSELDAEILWSSSEIVDDDLNNTSIVLRLGFTAADHDIAFLFTGDAEHAVEEILVAERANGLRATVLKAGHHGSNSSTTEAFLEKVRPQHVVITAGNQSFSGTMLPRAETLTRIENVSKKLNLDTCVWRTDHADKTPVLRPVGEETGDDTVLAKTDGVTLSIDYVLPRASTTTLDPSRCGAMTKAGAGANGDSPIERLPAGRTVATNRNQVKRH